MESTYKMNHTLYKLREICKWSVGHPNGEHRYVEIKTDVNQYGHRMGTVTLELPTEEAQRLVETMNAEPTKVQNLDTHLSNSDELHASNAMIAATWVRRFVEASCWPIGKNQDGVWVFDLRRPQDHGLSTEPEMMAQWHSDVTVVIAWARLTTSCWDSIAHQQRCGIRMSFSEDAGPQMCFYPVTTVYEAQG
jgi:hypothetical protein